MKIIEDFHQSNKTYENFYTFATDFWQYHHKFGIKIGIFIFN